MKTEENNYAFIDSQNLNLSIRSLGWYLDFIRFRVYLREKYQVNKAYLFIGYIQSNQSLYTFLQNSGYIIVFKPTLVYGDGKRKGNCDAELVLYTMIDYQNYDRAVIVAGDGDYYCLVDYLIKHDKLKKLIIPNKFDYSALLKKIPSEYLAFVSDLRRRVEYKKEKNPVRTEP